MDGGDGCTAIQIYLMSQKGTYKWLNGRFYAMYILPQKSKKFKFKTKNYIHLYFSTFRSWRAKTSFRDIKGICWSKL